MYDIVFVLFVLGATFVLALAVDRGIPNALESAAYLVEDIAAGVVALLRRAAEKLRVRHAEIEAANGCRGGGTGSGFAIVRKRGCNAA